MNEYLKIRCRRCGQETLLRAYGGYGKFGSKSRPAYIETEIPIRCPHCLMRLNRSAEAFRAQMVH